MNRRQAVEAAQKAAEKTQAAVRADSAVLAASIEEHRKATDSLLAAIEEQRKGWTSDV